MSRRVGWFSAGAPSTVACMLAKPDVIAYCETGSEDEDNRRYIDDCAKHFGWDILKLRSKKYKDTWEVWEKRNYVSGIQGAPCTSALKIAPRLEMQRVDDIHIFGYTVNEQPRANRLRENFFDLNIETPLIDAGLNKASCMAIVEKEGLELPRVYAMGYHNANCIPCPKATSPNYYALVRKTHPELFDRLAKLTRKLGVRLTRINDVRIFIDEIPDDWPTTNPIQPACDFLCAMTDFG